MSAELEPAAVPPLSKLGRTEDSLVRVASDGTTARRRVDEAYAFDRGATRLLYLAETQLAQAETDLAAFVDHADASERDHLDDAVVAARNELAAAGDYWAQCREALSEALDDLAATDTPSRREFGGEYSSSPAAAAVVAEATAIAATAQESLAAELHAGTVEAAKTAEQAVEAAAATVAHAAEASRQSRQIADELAAADVAAEAVATAASVQVHADVLAAVVAATAREAAEQLPHPGTAAATSTAARLAGQVTATARSQADETAAAARIVAAAVAADAAAVAAITSATATGIEQEVLVAAAAVQAIADAAALDLTLPTTRLAWDSTSCTDRRSADIKHAASDAAATAATAARFARAARLNAAAEAAATVAQAAAHTADAVHLRAMERADVFAADSVAAALTVSTSASGSVDALNAANLARTAVIDAVAAGAKQTALAAALVARSVAAAAEAMAARTAAEEVLIEHHVRDTALAMKAMTTATAIQLAAATLERESSVALAVRAAAAATERVLEANRQLESAGRHDHAVAVALQQAMLSELPQPAGMTIAARYVTAVEQDRVGGDWYDALLLPTGELTLMVGDVVGHDMTAAAMMGQLRTALRTLAYENRQPPSAVASRLDSIVRDWHLKTLATLILVNVDEPCADDAHSVATLQWTNAGHPAPILIHADGTALVLEDATDILLGVRPASARRDYSHPVPPGATLLLYTDGLIETRMQPHHQGRQRLLDTVRTHHRLELDELLDAVLADMIDTHPDDDIAFLAVRFA